MGNNRKAGVLAHVTSFPSPYGIGDLGKSTYVFLDFLKKAKQKVWQILPLGHTSFGDSPYQSFSTFAGNPLLISPDELQKEGYLCQSDLQNVPLFDHTSVDYGRVILYKTKLFHEAHKTFTQDATNEQQKNYEKFCKSNKDWLDHYALFISLKNYYIEERRYAFESEEYKRYRLENIKFLTENQINDCFYGAVWNSWDEDIKTLQPSAIAKWENTLANEISYYKFLQYEFFRQWDAVKQYANESGVEIMGDIPIYVASDSADVWANRDLFEMSEGVSPKEVAGVPPDYFSETGQLWGNPLYKWAEHKKTHYKWWIKRISKMLEMVDMVRIDHFRAFDSYWAIPYGEKTAEKGQWRKGPGEGFFAEVKKALGDIPIIAEDLGDLNPEVLTLRDTLGFPGMKILQFAFDSSANDYLPHNYKTSNAVVYTGTHDNDTVLGWYTETNAATKDLYRRYLNVSGDNVSWDLIRLAHSACADTAIIPIQDLMGLDGRARTNTPSVASGNWKFRYTDDMLSDDIAPQLLYLTELYNRV